METYKNVQGKWEFSKKEKAFIDYCLEKGYVILKCTQYVSKTKWEFRINENIVETWETVNDTTKFDKIQVDRYIKIRVEVEALRSEIKEING